MILLMDDLNVQSRLLLESLRAAGETCPAVSILYDGFLPSDVHSPYAYFIGDEEPCDGRPCYFDNLEVPPQWEIRGTNSDGEIWDYSKCRGRIYYQMPKHKRLVRIVDWLDEKGKVRWSDHYNRFGNRYAQTILNSEQKLLMRSFFDRKGREIITENFVTGTICLREGEKEKLFASRCDFVLYYLETIKAPMDKICYDSLSTPFQVSQTRKGHGEGREDILFWREEIREAIPYNMQVILEQKETRTGLICVQKREAYKRLIALGAEKERLRLLGYVYQKKGFAARKKQALVLTNSDQVEKMEEIAAALPDVVFYIGALTEMSTKLMALRKYKNVRLMPGINADTAQEILEESMFYLDINHQAEILDAVYQAYLCDLLILGFRKTMHNAAFVDPSNFYEIEDTAALIEKIRRTLEDPAFLEKECIAQNEAALAESAANYRALL